MNDNAITKHIHTGDVLQPVRDLKIDITIDVETMRRLVHSTEQARLALAGMAVRMSHLNRPDERNVIDQE